MIRSLLYVPASAPRFVARAHLRGADAIILDLEDSVAPDAKDAARAALAEAVPGTRQGGAAVFVRVNATPDRLHADLEAACRAGAEGAFLPKTRGPDGLAAVAAWLDRLEATLDRPAMRLVPVLEDPGAVLDARPIAAATPRNLAMLAGGEDLATAMGGEPIPELLALPKQLVHLAAKAAGLLSFGLLRSIADFTDLAAIGESARLARALGFDGATCIHPAVVPVLNAAFAPGAAALEAATRLIAAAAAQPDGAFVFEGRMVDAPIVERARRLLARAGPSADYPAFSTP